MLSNAFCRQYTTKGISFLEKLWDDFHSPVLLSRYLRPTEAFNTFLVCPLTTMLFSNNATDMEPALNFFTGVLFTIFITFDARHLT